MTFYKFPRTPHLFVLPGLNIRDDKILSEEDASLFFKTNMVIVEEKVDGANVGISFDNNELKLQNRGNYIQPNSEPQFETIWNWAYQKLSLLESHLGNRYILFGEWCYAKHSIYYKRLPDWFIGFDLYDKLINKFLATPKRNEILKQANIAIVPRIISKKITKQDIIRIINTEQSHLGGGGLEGIYLRIESHDFLISRAKVVRKDFIQEIDEHWSKKKLIKNELQ
jgi:ATP-dependent RNA circularization protein (DNA/RNA ligase family)